MIMSHGLGFEETYLAFRPLHGFFKNTSYLEIPVENTLRAFCCAKCLNWIDFGQNKEVIDEQSRPICMEEFDRDARYLELHFTQYMSNCIISISVDCH
jgi:hypothetical protein